MLGSFAIKIVFLNIKECYYVSSFTYHFFTHAIHLEISNAMSH